MIVVSVARMQPFNYNTTTGLMCLSRTGFTEQVVPGLDENAKSLPPWKRGKICIQSLRQTVFLWQAEPIERPLSFPVPCSKHISYFDRGKLSECDHIQTPYWRAISHGGTRVFSFRS